MSEYPSVLVVSENPVSEINGVGVALSFFFEGAPVDNMRVLFPPQVSAGINTPPAWRPYSHELSGWGGRRETKSVALSMGTACLLAGTVFAAMATAKARRVVPRCYLCPRQFNQIDRLHLLGFGDTGRAGGDSYRG
jgi:hypothetical protein